MSGLSPRALSERNIAMSGVMPLPALTNKIFGGGGSGRAKSPLGAARRTIVPGFTPLTRCVDRKPSGVALTVMVMRLSSRRGTDVNEYDRQCQRPSMRSPMPTYWPGWYSAEKPQPGLMVTVAESSVSVRTSTTSPRSSRADHSGLSSLR